MSTNQSKLPKRLKVVEDAIQLENGDEIGNIATGPEDSDIEFDRAMAESLVTRYNSHDALRSALEEARTALGLMRQHHDDLSKSNPGYMRKLCLQDYGLWNEAMMALEKGFRATTKALALSAERGEG